MRYAQRTPSSEPVCLEVPGPDTSPVTAEVVARSERGTEERAGCPTKHNRRLKFRNPGGSAMAHQPPIVRGRRCADLTLFGGTTWSEQRAFLPLSVTRTRCPQECWRLLRGPRWGQQGTEHVRCGRLYARKSSEFGGTPEPRSPGSSIVGLNDREEWGLCKGEFGASTKRPPPLVAG